MKVSEKFVLDILAMTYLILFLPGEKYTLACLKSNINNLLSIIGKNITKIIRENFKSQGLYYFIKMALLYLTFSMVSERENYENYKFKGQ